MSKFFLNLAMALLLSGLGAGAGWYASNTMQPAQWKASAQFEMPKVVDLGNYYALYSTYTLVKGDEAIATLDKAVSENSYNEFKRSITSPNVINTFLVQTDLAKSMAKVESKPVEEVAQRLAEGFQFQNDSDTLSVTTISPVHSVELLSHFIEFSTAQTRETLNSDLVAKWKILFQQVKQSAEQNLGAIQQNGQVIQQDWNGKLNLMKSVQPLDNMLMSYRLVKQPSTPLQAEAPKNQMMWIGIGAGIGFMLSLLVAGIIALGASKKED